MMRPLYKLLLFAFAASVTVSVSAYDFMVDGIAYNIRQSSGSLSGENGVVWVTYQQPSAVSWNGLIETPAYDPSIAYGSLTIPATVSYQGNVYDVKGIEYGAFAGCQSFYGSLTIPNSVSWIDDWAFAYCSFTGSLTIPDECEYIGNWAFTGCRGFSGSLTIPNSVLQIGCSTFYGCSGMNGTLSLGNRLKKIEPETFALCQFTGALTIPGALTEISSGAFIGCHFNQLTVEADNTKYDSRDNCNAVIETATNTLIWGANDFSIPRSVDKIGSNAFAGCYNYTGTLFIPEWITSIGDFAFAGCEGFTAVVSMIKDPQLVECGDYAFSGYEAYFGGDDEIYYDAPCVIMPLYVPCGTKQAYESTSPWSVFGVNEGIFEQCEQESYGDINGDGKVDVSDVNAVINITLKQKTEADYPGNADVTGDGKVDVSDVNAIINITLKLV